MREELEDLQRAIWDHFQVLKMLDRERGYASAKELLRAEICNEVELYLYDMFPKPITSVDMKEDYIATICFYDDDDVSFNLDDFEQFDRDSKDSVEIY